MYDIIGVESIQKAKTTIFEKPLGRGKENIWFKKGIGEYDDEQCHLICFLNFCELLENPSAVVYMYISSIAMHQQIIFFWGG